MLRLLRRLLSVSVFRSMKGCSMTDVFAALFHRMAATLYLIYAGWAVLQLGIEGVPSLVAQQGDQWTSIFAVFVLLTTAPACLGATFFPRLATLELYAGFAFILLLLVYYFFLVINILTGGGSIAGFELLLSVAVMPICRTAIIVYYLLKQAEERRLKAAQALIDQADPESEG